MPLLAYQVLDSAVWQIKAHGAIHHRRQPPLHYLDQMNRTPQLCVARQLQHVVAHVTAQILQIAYPARPDRDHDVHVLRLPRPDRPVAERLLPDDGPVVAHGQIAVLKLEPAEVGVLERRLHGERRVQPRCGVIARVVEGLDRRAEQSELGVGGAQRDQGKDQGDHAEDDERREEVHGALAAASAGGRPRLEHLRELVVAPAVELRRRRWTKLMKHAR